MPDGVEVHQYSCQKLNIWEFQKDQMRKSIQKDPHNFYTYAKDFLSLAFPVVNEQEAKLREKLESKARWKSKAGFDNYGSSENPN